MAEIGNLYFPHKNERCVYADRNSVTLIFTFYDTIQIKIFPFYFNYFFLIFYLILNYLKKDPIKDTKYFDNVLIISLSCLLRSTDWHEK